MIEWRERQNLGIAWNQVSESLRNMWSVYFAMPDDQNKHKMYECIIDITEQLSRMYGAMGD